MDTPRRWLVWVGGAIALLLLSLSYVALHYYYPSYRNRVIQTARAADSKIALANMMTDRGSASAVFLRNYRNAGLKRGLSILSASSRPNLDPPIPLYATLLLPKADKEGRIYLFWLEYDFNVDGIVLEFGDGSTESYAVFPIWNQTERDWFRALAHRDCAVEVFDESPKVRSALPNMPKIDVPVNRLRNLRSIRLRLFDGRVSSPVEVFVIPEELRSTTTP